MARSRRSRRSRSSTQGAGGSSQSQREDLQRGSLWGHTTVRSHNGDQIQSQDLDIDYSRSARNAINMDKRKCGAGASLVVILLVILTLVLWYFSSSGKEEMSEEVNGNYNKIQNEQHRELSLIHIEHMDKLGNTVNELEDKVKVHATVKYSLLLVIFLFIRQQMIQNAEED